MNSTMIVMQAVAQTAPVSAKPAEPATPAHDGQSFQEVMQQAVQQTSPPSAEQQTQTQQKNSLEVEQAGELPVGIRIVTVRDAEAMQGKWNFLASLFDVGALEGVDMEQSDMEILKDVSKNLNDPDAQFAMILMMAFLEANPDKSLADIEQNMGSDLLANQNISPVQKVFSAITRMMAEDPAVKSNSMLDQLMQLGKSGQPISRAFVSGLMQEMNLEHVSVKQSMVQPQSTAVAQTVLPKTDDLGRFEQMMMQIRQQTTAKQTGGTGETRETGVKLDVEKLQQQVDAGSFLRSSGYQAFQMEQAGGVKQLWVPMDAGELVNQVKTGIFSGLETGKNEFVFKLRPEGLGEMTVRLVETGTKTTLSIIASNMQTQKILSAELANLQAVMKPYEVEVQPVTTTQQSATSEQFLNGQFGQQMGEHQHNGNFQSQQQTMQQEEETRQPAAGVPSTMGTAALDTYI